MENENAIPFCLGNNAKNHILYVTSKLPELKSWFDETVESMKMEMNVLNKSTDFMGYINVITNVINKYISESEFDYGDGVTLFSDQTVLNLYNKNEIDYDQLCVLTFMGYTSGSDAQNIINQIELDVCKDPIKYEDSSIPYKIYLWKNEKITDFSMIKFIINCWMWILINERIYIHDSNFIDELEIKEKFTSLAYNKLNM